MKALAEAARCRTLADFAPDSPPSFGSSMAADTRLMSDTVDESDESHSPRWTGQAPAAGRESSPADTTACCSETTGTVEERATALGAAAERRRGQEYGPAEDLDWLMLV